MEKDDYVGRILTGRITSGVVRINDRVHGLRDTDAGVIKIEDGKVCEYILYYTILVVVNRFFTYASYAYATLIFVCKKKSVN